ncbi:acyl-CoA synthetase (AMP-forming)/AMP-acid ligase II [Halobacteroides halobius DSM 5150]|uniref:Acyl-CoA synthetase (AMP-forming)/AMP-acid ligase II n=1 Tax=Halobacteroides halobius (strain ATCC 35273 / DSM 5150 / MD-1) TaxID=748449 RepID=L0K5G0_HALHC|nr:AMP-binding protein [Halobacteroides halobius]AGB40251.1 acyl-CoA synthetase (AMP-forming)/AMP-acid ligase II [Halobacteroides halobius DSM 5150]
MLIHETIKQQAQQDPTKTVLINGEEKISYQELNQQITTIASKLATLTNLQDKIIIKLANPIEELVYFLGASKAGLASVLVATDLPEKNYQNIIQRINPKLIINQDFTLPQQMSNKLPTVEDKHLFLGALSSGSTGQPKIIWRNHRSWVSAFAHQSRLFNLDSSARLLLVGPLVYTGNLNSAIHLIYEGGTIVFAESNFPNSWLKDIVEYNISALFMVPAHYRILIKRLKEPLQRIKSLVGTGAKLDTATVKKLQNYFPKAQICQYYGASELGHVSYALAKDMIEKPDTVGRIFPEVTAWTEDNLVWVKSPYLATDYQPQATANDLGKINEDNYLYLFGRADDIINQGGVKINLNQIKETLTNYSKIDQAAVISLDNQLKGKEVAVAIVTDDTTLTKQEVRDFCQTNLAKDKQPQKILFLEKMPRTKVGKIDRNKLSKLFRKLP